MDSNLSRQYSPPASVSPTITGHYYQQAQAASRNSNNSNNLPSLPTASDLSSIKADLERVLSHSDKRQKHLEKDLNHLQKNVNIRDSGDGRAGTSGKSVNMMMRIKRESDDLSSNSSQPKPLDRQTALETLRRRRRRDEVDDSEEDQPTSTRSESPLVKMKKLDTGPTSHSVSPPPVSKSPSFGKHHKPSEGQTKKKKSNKAASQGKHPKPKSAHTKTTNDVDFVRVKPKDQVSVLTFWSAMEPYFRPLTEDDRKFLLEKGDDVKPYLLPPLGRHYIETWAEEENAPVPQRGRSNSPAATRREGSSGPHNKDHGESSSSSSSTAATAMNGTGPTAAAAGAGGEAGATGIDAKEPDPIPERARYLKPGEPLTDDYLLTEDLSCGSLAERLLSSLVIEDMVDITELKDLITLEDAATTDGGDSDDVDDMDVDSVSSSEGGRTVVELSNDPSEDIVDFEERLKRELRYAGLFSDADIAWNAREDDDICAELRRLGRELKDQVSVNDFRKKRLLEVVDRQLQYEQYRNVLDTYDAQVEQCYMKRFRIQKSKKRKATAPKAMLSENAVNAMDKRRTWINGLGPIFKDKNIVMPSKSIYRDDFDDDENPEMDDNSDYHVTTSSSNNNNTPATNTT
ncbi:histone acetyltransferases subunit 3-domain-containing protein [Zychaea mexicana]|uniref:histone acetyltransferases subunit 3-domain-containing protein n=1 Tax=Zychaea mexicana TaxID=64656 RepID=UPI0022FDFFE8|nr:histone acetyltransferases subunit 3-domain-containing protein [Zychaea mexicana]KAI9497599.1 histone acetyltransferases subunit 3-domain-containing protein [Zychaea mexicana]